MLGNEIRAALRAGASDSEIAATAEGNGSQVGGAPGSPTIPKWDIHERVPGQLNDPRMGRLQGKLTVDDPTGLANNPNARISWDARSNTINIIQEVDGKLLRFTVARVKPQIISVGPVQERNITNSVGRGDWIDMRR